MSERWYTIDNEYASSPNYEFNLQGVVRNKKTGRILIPTQRVQEGLQENRQWCIRLPGCFAKPRNPGKNKLCPKNINIARMMLFQIAGPPPWYQTKEGKWRQMEVSHITDLDQDNRYANLRWATRAENMASRRAERIAAAKRKYAATMAAKRKLKEHGEGVQLHI